MAGASSRSCSVENFCARWPPARCPTRSLSATTCLQLRVAVTSVAAYVWEAPMLDLYHNNISVCAQKVRIVLSEKGQPWTNHHLSLARGEQLTPQFKEMNPRA